MRKPEQRKGRSCIRPEFPRSKHTGGREGTSRDQFATMMRGMALSDSVVNWDHKNLDYLRRPQYDRWLRRLLDQAEAVDLTAVESYAGHGGEFKIYYTISLTPNCCFFLVKNNNNFLCLTESLRGRVSAPTFAPRQAHTRRPSSPLKKKHPCKPSLMNSEPYSHKLLCLSVHWVQLFESVC
eukprot:NODE_1934_length_1031_cov_83.679226_g1573_i0.p1 GENE.NODE_1934_length_1031_cov_83.679226_g1573_i0~~NODE_1934_length_1031_cov_83.679226_g1573_i0.p1  ORF type:complete len:181 (+),score=22.40 NODE_1934_length_1031_cov_83.679226_g1573_i0:287-829(+)